MEIHTVYFDGTGHTRSDFAKLRDVFIASCRQHMPDIRLVVHNLPPCGTYPRSYGMASNTHKLAKWVEITEEADNDIVLCDCDIMFSGRVDDAFDEPFDVGYTSRTGPYPFNNGVMFVRNTDDAKEVMRRWLNVNNAMYKNPPFHFQYREKYAGMNQAAWGYMLECDDLPGVVKAIDPKFNACDREWLSLDDIRVYHIKSELRHCCLADKNPKHEYAEIVNEFKRFCECLDHSGVPGA